MSESRVAAAINEMREQGDDVLYCRHVAALEGAPDCCHDCHTDEESGFGDLYDDQPTDTIGVTHHLCCCKRDWLEAGDE